MIKPGPLPSAQISDSAWISLPGGELDAPRPRTLCPACRAAQLASSSRSGASSAPRPLCFACYRTDAARQRAFAKAADLNTASEARFQGVLPFEPVNRLRLEMLRADRASVRTASQQGTGRFVDQRRRAQIEARHALERLAAGLRSRHDGTLPKWTDAAHAAELQLPEAWLPFVVGR